MGILETMEFYTVVHPKILSNLKILSLSMIHAKFQHRSYQCLYSGSVQGKRLLRKIFEIDSMDILPICTLILGFVKDKIFLT